MLESSQEEEKKIEVSSIIGSGSGGSNENSSQMPHEDSIVGQSLGRMEISTINRGKKRVAFSVLNVVKDDPNFEAFFNKYLELQ